jgi:glycosyltransferase involved in cell wall biosynthesis
MPTNTKQTLPQVIVAQLGARMHYAVPVILHRAGMLAHFYTDAYTGPGSAWHLPARCLRRLPDRWQPNRLRRLLARQAPELPAQKVTAFNLLGLAYAQALQRAKTIDEKIKIYISYGHRFGEKVISNHFFGSQYVYVFQGPGLILKSAKQKGLKSIYERFIAPYVIQNNILLIESSLWNNWEYNIFNNNLSDIISNLEIDSYQSADIIICPSDFVLQGMMQLGIDNSKLRVVPYGYEPPADLPPRTPWDGRRPLRLLFVGAVSLRKGVQYLALALEKLRGLPLEARVVGPIDLAPPGRRRLGAVAQLTGQVPRPEVRRHYQWADIFVFPSLCEGSATVTYEALAHGLPVITTFNAGSVVRDGIDGYIVPIRDAEALAARIEHLYHHSELLAEMSKQAQRRARDFTWDNYKERLIDVFLKNREIDYEQ